MSEANKPGQEDRAPGDSGAAEEQAEEGPDGGRFKRGWNRGLGVLSAFKEAIDETLEEARERGDLNPDRAKELMRGALERAGEAAGEAKSRLEFVPRREFEALKARVAAVERAVGLESPPDPSEDEPASPRPPAPDGSSA